jgi:hypothetical protein
MKKTDWFAGDVEPVHVGVYQRQYDDGHEMFSKWDGVEFKRAGFSVDGANIARMASPRQGLPWRGLAENPVSK